MDYKSINPKELKGNMFELIGDKWMLITAKKHTGNNSINNTEFNTMTASWGGMGIMWNKPVVWCVIRPQRYTYEFIEDADYFTLSFFPNEYRKALNILGTKSGRDSDKVTESGLTPIDLSDICGISEQCKNKVVSFKEADTILTCKKLYYQDINPINFIEKTLDKNYPIKDYHRMYIGEIISCNVK